MKLVMGLILITCSIALTAYTLIKDEIKKQENIKLEKNIQKKIELPKEDEKNNNKVNNECLSCDVENKEEETKEKQNKEDIKILADTSIIGVIRIDKLDVVLPIRSDASQKSLLDGAGLVENTDFPSVEKNTLTVLAGHRGGRNRKQSFFYIDKLENGDTIKITLSNQVLTYHVVGEQIIEPDDWSGFTREEDKTKLFLMSCHPYPVNDKRLIIKAELNGIKNM